MSIASIMHTATKAMSDAGETACVLPGPINTYIALVHLEDAWSVLCSPVLVPPREYGGPISKAELGIIGKCRVLVYDDESADSFLQSARYCVKAPPFKCTLYLFGRQSLQRANMRSGMRLTEVVRAMKPSEFMKMSAEGWDSVGQNLGVGPIPAPL